MTVGAAGGILYLGSPADGAELLTVAPNNAGTRVFGYEIENSVNGEITFVFVSNKIIDGAAEEASVSVSVSYDNVPVEVSVENVTTGKAGGEWTYSDENGYVTLKPVISVGLSGIAEVSYSYLDENGEWSAYSAPSGEGYAVSFATSDFDFLEIQSRQQRRRRYGKRNIRTEDRQYRTYLIRERERHSDRGKRRV